MRSKSYYAIAGSSILLLTLGCLSNSAKKPDRRADPAVAAASAKADQKKDEKKAEDKADDGGFGYGDGEETGTANAEAGAVPPDASGETGEEPFGEPESLDGPPPSTKPRHDGCKKGAMKFEGKCLNKDRVEKILEKRDEEVKQRVYDAKSPQQQADAAHDLLEQQIAQMDKTEDDLDEIIQQLQEENAKKYGDPPDKNEDKP
jgi:hypothetical protein